MKKISLEIEILLPTKVTREVEFPMYVFSKKNNSYYQYEICNSGYQWSAIKEKEIRFLYDNSVRLYQTSLSESQFAKVLSEVEGDLEIVPKIDFIGAYNIFITQETQKLNELMNQK